MARLPMVAAAILAQLVGRAYPQLVGGDGAGRFPFELVGLLLVAFLCCVACSVVTLALFSRTWTPKRSTNHRGLSELAAEAISPSSGVDVRRQGRAVLKPPESDLSGLVLGLGLLPQEYASRKGVRQVGIDVLWWSGVLLTLFVVGAFAWIFSK